MDVFKDSARSVECVVLWHHTDTATGQRRRLHDVNPGDPHSARSRQSTGRADAYRRCFTRAVRSKQAKEFSLPNAEVDAVDGDHALLAVIDLLQAFNLYDHCGFIPWRFLRLYATGTVAQLTRTISDTAH